MLLQVRAAAGASVQRQQQAAMPGGGVELGLAAGAARRRHAAGQSCTLLARHSCDELPLLPTLPSQDVPGVAFGTIPNRADGTLLKIIPKSEQGKRGCTRPNQRHPILVLHFVAT